MTEIVTIQNVRGYEKDGTAYLNAEDAARGLGFIQMKDNVEYVRWDRVNQYLQEFNFSPLVGKDDYIPENIFYRLAMKAKNEVAEKFQAKVAENIQTLFAVKRGIALSQAIDTVGIATGFKFNNLK